jgi:uncharacterized protein (DUF1800 family)
MSREQAVIALRRLGLGARPGDIDRVANDPKGYLLASLRGPAAAHIASSDLGSSLDNYDAFHSSFRRLRAERRNLGKNRQTMAAPGMSPSQMSNSQIPGSQMPNSEMPNSEMSGPSELTKAHRKLRRQLRSDELTARVGHAVTTDAAFIERLAMFWSNHFCISAAKGGIVNAIAGAYEREVIRPHVLGRFGDMLRAAEQHPAMLIYLDNNRSLGPNSRAGLRSGKGLNENLAREILELHTVGVKGGYNQADVTNFARILTGWKVVHPKSKRGRPGAFVYRRNTHEPGEFTVMGRRYPDEGVATGERVLDDLARHPATARHIAQKLAVHFVSENPPPALVQKLERTFRDTDGDLREVAIALLESDDVWRAPLVKVLPPYDFLISIMRGLDITAPVLHPDRLLKRLGQPLWSPPSPKGWPDGDDVWAGPSAIRERLRIATRVAQLARRHPSPADTADLLLGPGISSYARQAIARAQSPEQGFELLIMSPAFQRR